MLEGEFVRDNLAILRARDEIPGVVLEMRVDFVLNGFLPLFPACGMIDSFLNCCRFVLVVGIDVPCNLCHANSWCFVEVFVFELRRGKDALVWSCRRPC